MGRSSIELELPPGASVGDLAQLLVGRFGQLPRSEALVMAVNLEYQDHDYALSDGDEVALIPPVSGGQHD